MRYLVRLAENDLVVPGALLADPRARPRARRTSPLSAPSPIPRQALYAAARTYPTRYLRIRVARPREGPLPAADVEYPETRRPRPCLRQRHLFAAGFRGRRSPPHRRPRSTTASLASREREPHWGRPQNSHPGLMETMLQGRRAAGCARRSDQGQRPDQVRQGRARASRTVPSSWTFGRRGADPARPCSR